MTSTDSATDHITEADRAIWRAMASSQGLVCVVCGRIPRLERRPAFYDTGLCRACDEELDATGDAN